MRQREYIERDLEGQPMYRAVTYGALSRTAVAPWSIYSYSPYGSPEFLGVAKAVTAREAISLMLTSVIQERHDWDSEGICSACNANMFGADDIPTYCPEGRPIEGER